MSGLTFMDVLIETHVGLDHLGPGSTEMTLKALGFLDSLDEISHVADMGCGTGRQTRDLARHLSGTITGIDLSPEFIAVFNENTRRLNLQDKIKGVVGSMEELPFRKEEFDLIWSEGAIDSIGFEKGLRYWNNFLKVGGFVAVTSPSWLSAEHPVEVEQFWTDAGSRLDSVEDNISILQDCGYNFIAAFALPKECWIDNYFAPREAAEAALQEKYAGNATVEAYIKSSKREVELYSKYKEHYGYAFYIGKKL